MATEVAQLIFKADTSQLKSAEKQVDSLGAKTQKTSNNTQVFGRKAGMASIQVEQLVGQIAGGQNPMRAFGVQAADLGFVLGVPLLGSVVAVSAAFLSMIPSLASAEDESKTLADEVKSLTVNLNELTDAQRAAVAIQFTKEIQQLNKQISGTGGLNTYLGIATEKVERLEATMAGGNFVLPNGARVSQEEFEKVLNKSREEVTNLQAQIDGNNISIKNMQGILDGTVGSTQDYIDSLREESIVLGMSARQKALYTAQAQGATAAQLAEINATFDLIDAKNAAILAQKQEEDAQKRAAQTAATKAAADKRAADAAARRFASQSAAASEHAQQLALLQLDQEAREKQQHDNAVAALKNQKDQQLITEQEYHDAVMGLVAERERRTQEAQKRTAESDAADRQRRLDDAWREHYENMDMLDRYAYHFEENMITMRDVGAAAMMTFENAVGNAFEQFVTGQINAEEALQMVTRSILSGVINAFYVLWGLHLQGLIENYPHVLLGSCFLFYRNRATHHALLQNRYCAALHLVVSKMTALHANLSSYRRFYKTAVAFHHLGYSALAFSTSLWFARTIR